MAKDFSSNYILYVLGSRGTRPTHGKDFEIFGGQTTCYLIKHGKHAVIVDCGTGLYDAEKLLADCDTIDIIFTHVHYDHMLGLLDFSIFPKNARINLLGTFRSWLAYDTIKEFFRHPFWPIQPNLGVLCEITNDGTPYNLSDGITLQVYNSFHPDAGNIITLDVSGKRVCFMFDVEDVGKIDHNVVKKCNFLIFDGMYEDAEYDDHVGWGHSTYQEGCRLAGIYACDELLITHHSPKHTDKELLAMEEKAKLIYPKTRFARAGDMFNIE